MAAAIPGAHQKTIGTDENYDTRGMVAELRRIGVATHVPQNSARSGGSAIDGRTTGHEGYGKSINGRRGIEKVFSWIKQWGGLRQFKLLGHRQGECGVWPARDRLQSDPAGQPAQAGDGGGMNRWLPRGVARRQR